MLPSRLSYLITYSVSLLGLFASFLRVFYGYRSILLLDPSHLCLVLDNNDFSLLDNISAFDPHSLFTRQVDMSGFGNGQFDMSTASSNNSFVKNNRLYILPTLTADAIGQQNVLDGHVYNLTDCTFNDTTATFDPLAYRKACSAVSNSTAGTVINPVQSARLSTKYSASIKYGKVQVVAKLPTGDWLWPAIWMLPVDETYGPWPLSGEIDIMEARGNGPLYPKQGTNFVRGSLNWGPAPFLNAVAKTFGTWTKRWSSYDRSFHTYTLEWDEDFIRISVDSRLHHMLSLHFDQPFFTRGAFPSVVRNGFIAQVLENPWINGTNATPFDQPFYLILDVSVGGTNGWFPDNVGGKPWLDGSPTAMRDFTLAQDQWYSTWPTDPDERAMIVESVRMWQRC